MKHLYWVLVRARFGDASLQYDVLVRHPKKMIDQRDLESFKAILLKAAVVPVTDYGEMAPSWHPAERVELINLNYHGECE